MAYVRDVLGSTSRACTYCGDRSGVTPRLRCILLCRACAFKILLDNNAS